MGWVTLDDNFPDHPKTLAAGRVAAYVFIVSLCYCRKFHTGGFVPSTALPTLGATKGHAQALVASGLWDAVDGGWQVHGYAERYDDTTAKERAEERRRQKQEAGRRGGIASWQSRSASSRTEAGASASASSFASHCASASAEAHKGIGTGEGVGFGISSEKQGVEFRADVLFERLVREYPQHRINRSVMAQQAFSAALFVVSGDIAGTVSTPSERFDRMLANLATQKAGDQWADSRMVPRLDRWLIEGLWQQVHEPAKAAMTRKTSTTAAAVAEILSQPDVPGRVAL